MADDFGSIPIDAPEKANAPKPPRKRRDKSTVTTSEPIVTEESLSNIDLPQESPVSPSPEQQTEDGPKQPQQQDRNEKPEPGSRKLVYSALFATVFLLFSFGLYSLAGFIGVPYLLQQKLSQLISDNSDFALNEPHISFNPYTFTLDIEDIAVDNGKRQKDSKLISVRTVKAHIDPASLLERKIIVSDFTINTPKLALRRATDGSYNFGDALQKKMARNIFEQIPFLFAVKNIAIENGAFTFNDEPTAKLHTGEDITAFYPGFGNFNFSRNTLLPPSFSATINGSPVHFAKDSSSSIKDKITMDVENMDLGLYLNYLPISIPFDFKQARAQGQFELFFAKSKTGEEQLTIGFQVKAQGVRLQHHSKKARLSMDKLAITAQYQPFSKDIDIKEMSIATPVLDIIDNTDLQGGLAPLFPKTFLQKEANRLCLEKLHISGGRINIGGNNGTTFENGELTLLGYESNESSMFSPLSFSYENSKDQSSTSWQGHLTSDRAEGELQWKNVPIEQVLGFVGAPHNPKDKGRANISGPLSIKRDIDGGQFTTSLGKGNISLSKVELYNRNSLWLKSDKIDILGINLSEEKKRLGDVTIHKGKLSLNGNQLPALLSKISQKKSSISSLDFTGTAKIVKKGLPTIDIKLFKLYADKLDQDQLSADNLQISATFADKSSATAKGRGKISPLSLWLGVKFKRLKSQEVLAWFCTEKVFSETNSRISGSGRLILPSLSFKGDIESGPATVKQNGKTLFKWQANSVKGLEYKTSDKSLNIATITVEAPTLTWNRGQKEPAIYSKTRNFMVNLLGEYGVNKRAPLKSLKIRKISFKDGTLSIRDQRFKKPWNGRISSFAGTLEAIDSTTKTAPFVFNYSGTFAGASIRLQGNAEVFSPSPHHEFTLNLKNFPPATFAAQLPELGKKTTLPGFVDIKIFQKSSKKQINTVTDILLKKVTPTNDKEALTLALLRGTKEHATISVLSQNYQPEKDVPLILSIQKQINKLLVKAEISPFLLVDKKYTDLVNLSSVEYRFGEISPTGKATKELMHLRDFLNDYPLLSLVIHGEASLSADRAAMQKQLQEAEAERVRLINEDRLGSWNADHNTIASEPTEGDFVEENIFIPVQPQTVEVPHQMLIDLANQRAEILHNALVKQLGLSEDRIIVKKTTTLSENSSNVARFSLTAKP